ncbi:MAG: 3-isopropylmalate dehydratase large subunit, partial [Nitrospinota bacterium]
MGKTIAEKILSAKSGREVKAGEIVLAELDFIYGVDSIGSLNIQLFREMGQGRAFDPARCAFVMDHMAPAHNA